MIGNEPEYFTPKATYEVRFEIEVRAPSPEQAARIVRDMLLDPDARLACDVRPLEYIAEAEDWFPAVDHGTMVYFGDHRHGRVSADPVRPSDSVAYETVKGPSGE
jgi:hypothetical protein